MKNSFRGVVVWLIVTFFVVYGFFLNTAGSVFAGAIQSTLKASSIGVTYAVGSFIVGFACMQIPAGYLLDRYRIRWVVSSGLFLLAIGNLALSFSTTLFLFCISNFIQGVGASFAFLAAAKLISEWFNAKLFPIMFGLTQSLSCVLAAFIHYYLVLALQSVTWQKIYQDLSMLGLFLLVCALIWVRSPESRKQTKPISLGKSLSLVCKNSQIWLCAVCAATSFGALAAYASFWYLKVQEFYDVPVPSALVISGVIFAGIGLGTPFWGWVSNRVQSRIMVTHVTLAAGTIFLILGLYLPHFDIKTYLPIKAISFGIGFFLSGSMLLYTSASELSTDNTRAVAIGVVNTLVFLFNTFMLFLPQAFITEESTRFFTFLWSLPASLLVSILLLPFVRETCSSSRS